MKVRFAGKKYEVDRQAIEKGLQGAEPENGRRFFIEIGGTLYPVKQAIGAAIGRPMVEIGTNVCYSTLRKLGFEVIDAGGGHE